MNLPDAPIANEGFFATHFFTVRDQEKSKDFYVRILGAKVIKAENPCYIKLANTWIILNSGGGPTRQARGSPRNSVASQYRK
jgi:catechol 2,3-dioxygenase-like lactoylglutathione lyase family enzyme